MSKATRVLIALIIVAILGFGAFVMLGRPDDQTMIQQALAESIKASREGRPGGVMDKLSLNVKVNDEEYKGNSQQIADFIRKSRPEVSFSNTKAIITGDEARIISPAHLKAQILTQTMERDLSSVTLVFKREDDRAYLVFPVKNWKLAEVRVDPSVIGELTMG